MAELTDFSRMMEMEGVRPVAAKAKPTPPVRKAAPPPRPAQQAAAPVAIPQAAPAVPMYAWVAGPAARIALETALKRVLEETRRGRRGWATGIRQDGTSMALPATSGAAALISVADRHDLRLVVIGGDGWTHVMHPALGVATLDRDPQGDAA